MLLLPALVFAGILKGEVTDAKGEPLPFATVFIKGTTTGTAANASAEYSLALAPGTHKVHCQYMGFEQAVFTVTIKGDETITHNFALKEQSLTMQNVMVKANAEDPAYAIIRKAIKKRKAHLEQVKQFQSNIYMKAVIRNRDLPDKLFGVSMNSQDLSSVGGGGADSNSLGVMYLSEQYADYYSDGKRDRTIIRSVRESGNPNGFGISQLPPVVSFYENNVNPLWNISERGFISPIAEGALNYYKYKYEGEFVQDGFTVDKIIVIPKRAYEPLFQGTIYIVEKEWAIHSLNLLLTKKSNLAQIDTLRIEQTYLPLNKDTWIIKSQVQYPTLKFLGMDFTANFITVYDKQLINQPVPDSLFGGKIIASYDKEAKKKDTSYWTENRALPLENDEVEDYHKKDSVISKLSSPAYRDSMRRLGNRFTVDKLFTDGIHYTSKGFKSNFSTNALLDGLVAYNTVEGLAVVPKVWWRHSIDTGKVLNLVVAARYGFGNTHFNSFGKLSYTQYNRAWRTRKWEAGVEGGKYIFQYNQRSTVTPLYNTITTLAYGKNYMKLYERWTSAAFFEQNLGNGFRWKVKAGYQQRIPLANTTFYTWANEKDQRWESNEPVTLDKVKWEPHNAVLAKIAATYQPGVKYIQYPEFKSPQGSIWPEFTLAYEKGVPNILNSKSDFDKWSFGIADYVNMKMMGSIEYNILVGGFLNKKYISLPDMMHLSDNQLAISAPYLQSFQLAPYYKYSNTAPFYTEAHLEWNLNGLLTNKIPLLRQARWNIVLGTNTLFMDVNNYYTEAFVGVDNLGYKIFRFLRVDLVQSWDSYNNRHTGIRIGLDMNALGAMGGVSVSEDKENFDW